MTIRVTVALVLTAVLTAGCTSLSQEPPMDPQATLAARATSAQAVARYEEMQKEIRDHLDTAVGPFRWEVTGKGTRASCGGDLSRTDGVVVYMDPWGFDGHIPDADWARAKEIITTIAARYGFTVPTLQIDKPGHHETTGTDPNIGAQYSFGTQVNTSIQVTTGCHPPA